MRVRVCVRAFAGERTQEMGSMLRETLKSLCYKTGWSYAVFWKLRLQNRMTLIWEEGYYESANTADASNRSTFLAPNPLLNGWDTAGNPLDQGVCSQDGSSMKEDQVGQAVAKMSHQVHSLGEGIIGRVAFNGKHQWVFRENFTGNSPSIFECRDGWQNQFAAGIKTIAVIAVVPHGVVQLGSTQMIMENLELVSNIKILFRKFQHVPGAFLSDREQEFLYGKIHGSFSALPLSSHGNQTMIGTGNATLLHGLSNQPMSKNLSSSVPEQGGSSLYSLGMTKGLQAQSCSLPSMCSSSGSAKASIHFSQFWQNRMQLNSPTPLVPSGQETQMGETRTPSCARVICPFQGMTQTNTHAADSHQGLLLGSDTGSNRLALMEQQLVKEMGLQGQLHRFPSNNGQSAVQPKFHNNPLSGFQEASVLNSTVGKVEPISTGIVLPDNFNPSNKEGGVVRAALFDAGAPYPSALKQSDMLLPSVPTFQDVAGYSENSVASSRPIGHTNQVARLDANQVSLAEGDVSSSAYKVPTFPSVNIQACGSDARQLSHDSWGMSTGQLDTSLLETLSNDLIPSLGDDLSMTEALGVEQQSWDKENMAKDMPSLFQENMVDNLFPIKESSKVSETGFGELLAITDDCSPHGFDDFDTYLKSLSKGQDNSTNAISVLPAADELFDALVPAFRSSQDQVIWDEVLFPRADGNNAKGSTHSLELSTGSAVVSEVDVVQSFSASTHMGLEGTFFPECKSEHLLDAVVANIRPTVNKSANDNMPSKTTFSRLTATPSLYSPSVMADSCLTGPLGACDKKRSEFVGYSQCLENANLRNLQNPAYTSEFQGELAVKRSSSNDSSLKRQLNSWVEDGQSVKCENPGFAQVKKSDEPVKVNRKRARPGESTRPRPKDRQQIQDRVKELREIVPNGTKCSIDALLERTIKHMLFLQSVTKHADKLKQSGESKVLDKDGSLIARDNLEGGASWALELGGQGMGCPIVVENLNQPRQMLVEMLCEERGLFLEIADIIRGLGLTILKGVMEARGDKIWARFAVEANRDDVRRVEILWSLMRLLQQNTKTSSGPTSQSSLATPQGIDGGSHTFNVFQQPLIPTLGMAERLQ